MTPTLGSRTGYLSTLRAHLYHLAVEVDTRSGEIVISLVTLIWSLWLTFAPHDAWPKLDDALRHIGGATFWTATGYVAGGYLGLSLFWRYPKHRTVAGIVFSAYWTFLAYCMAASNPYLFFVWLASALAIIGMWVVMHRFATPKHVLSAMR